MTNLRLEAAQESLTAAESAHAAAVAFVAADTASRMAEVENAIRTGDARRGQGGSSSPTPPRSRAYRTRESGSSTSGRRRSRQPPKQELRDQIVMAPSAFISTTSTGPKKEFYDFVRSASAKLNQAIKAHNKGSLTAHNRLPDTIIGITLPAPETPGRPSGTARVATNLNFMRKNCAGRTVVTAQHPGVSGLERYAQ